MTKEEYINKMKQHEIEFELLWRKIVDDTNDFIKDNPDGKCTDAFTNNVELFIDTLCLSGAWIQDRLNEQKLRPQKLLAHYSAKEFKEYKEKARIFVLERIAYFNTFYNYKIGKVFIRNQKTRWGSCSSKGNLNFNYKIVLSIWTNF